MKSLNRINNILDDSIAPIVDLELFNRILIFSIDGIGDNILKSSFYREIRRITPEAFISILVRPECAFLYENCPYIDEIVELKDLEYSMSNTSFYLKNCNTDKVVEYIKDNNIDLILSPNWWDDKLIYKILKKVNNICRIGVACIEEFEEEIFDYSYSYLISSHESEKNLGLLEYLGYKISNKKLEIWSNLKYEIEVQDFIHNISKPIVVMSIGGSVIGKRFDVRKFALLSDMIIDYFGGSVVITGGKDVIEESNIFFKFSKNQVINLIDKKSLFFLYELFKYCKFSICNDSSVMHVSSVAECPTVGLFVQPVSQKKIYNEIIRFHPYCENYLVIPCLNYSMYEYKDKSLNEEEIYFVKDMLKKIKNFMEGIK